MSRPKCDHFTRVLGQQTFIGTRQLLLQEDRKSSCLGFQSISWFIKTFYVLMMYGDDEDEDDDMMQRV